jgi:hypothetical protein
MRGPMLSVWIVAEASGKLQLSGCIPVDPRIDFLQVVGKRSIDVNVVGEYAVGNATRNLRYQHL